MRRDELLYHYERELHFVRRLAWQFAEKYPEVAGRLLLEENRAADPHVERIIEAFAMMAARVHLRLDDDFSEVTDALLGILYPHYLNPIPSVTVVQLALDPEQGRASDGVPVERHTLLFSREVETVRCRFRTCYPVRLWPIEVASVELLPTSALEAAVPAEARSALRIRIRSQAGIPLPELNIDRLGFFLDAPGGVLQPLYEMFARDALGVHVRRGEESKGQLLGREHVRPLGFDADEGLLEYPVTSFRGYRLLQEYFAFPEKFQFVEVTGLPPSLPDSPHDFMDVSLLLPQSLAEIEIRPGPEMLKLGCTPAVNLFEQRADPIRLDHAAVEYRITPDVRAPLFYEVHSIQSVWSTVAGSAESQYFEPFYGIRHGMGRTDAVAFWHAMRRPSLRKDDPGTEVYLTLVDRQFDPTQPPVDILNVETLCTNRDLPAKLPFGDVQGDLQLEGRPEIRKIRCLKKPTAPIRAPLGPDSRWRIVSHLALNHLSLVDGDLQSGPESRGQSPARALEALREILKLYDFTDSPVTRQRIAGLIGLRARRVLRRVGRGDAAGFARGVEVDLEFDAQRFTGAGVFLFASILERFLGLYTSINSFTQTVARVRHREDPLKRWPPRAGEIPLL